MSMISKEWSATDAKRHFSEVLAEAAVAPQIVLLRGKPAGVIVSYERFLHGEEHASQRSVSDWLRDLESLRENEPDPEIPQRVGRREQFVADSSGDDWE